MAEEKTESIRDTINSAWEGEVERVIQDQEPDASKQLEAEAEPTAQDELELEPQKEPEVEDDGDEGSSSIEAADEDGEEAGSADDERGPDYRSPHQAPTRFTRSQKRAFFKLPENLQAVVADSIKRVEREVEDQLQQAESFIKDYEGVDRLIAPRREYMQQAGISPTMLVEQMLNLSDWGERDPVALIDWFAQSKGIDLRSIYGGSPSAGPAQGSPQAGARPSAQAQQPPAPDPALAARLDQLEQQTNRFAQTVSQREQAEEAARLDEMKTEIREFREATDERGERLHPHFEELYDDMIALVRGKRARDLTEAYDMAKRANPTVFHSIQNEREERDRVAEAQRRRQRAIKAKRASKSLGGGDATGTSPSDPGPGDRSVRAAIEAHWDASEQARL